MLTIDLVDCSYNDMIAFDTSAQGYLIILTDWDTVKSMTPRNKTIGTADKKGKLRVTHKGKSGE